MHPLRSNVSSGMPQTHLIEKYGYRWFQGLDWILVSFLSLSYSVVLIYCYRTVAGYEAKMTGLSVDFFQMRLDLKQKK